ncbi:hypothetical protein ACJX0J_036318 [Zea mays]
MKDQDRSRSGGIIIAWRSKLGVSNSNINRAMMGRRLFLQLGIRGGAAQLFYGADCDIYVFFGSIAPSFGGLEACFYTIQQVPCFYTIQHLVPFELGPSYNEREKNKGWAVKEEPLPREPNMMILVL